jgi:hypothetical protein
VTHRSIVGGPAGGPAHVIELVLQKFVLLQVLEPKCEALLTIGIDTVEQKIVILKLNH